MKINIVSHIGDWVDHEALRGFEVMNIPASIPALLDLEREKIQFNSFSSFLQQQDYLEIWRESARNVKALMDLSFNLGHPDRPNLIVIHAYSLFLLLSQIRLVSRGLDIASAGKRVEEVTIEDPAGQDIESTLFFDSLHSPLFHAIARLWAGERGIRVLTVPPGPRPVKCVWSQTLRGRLVEICCKGPEYIRSALKEVLTKISTVSNPVLLRSPRDNRLLCYLPSKGASLGRWAPKWAMDVGRFLLTCQKTNTNGPNGFSCEEIQIFGRVLKGPELDLVLERFGSHLRRTWAQGFAIFSWFSRFIENQIAFGFNPVFMAAGPFTDWNFHSYVANAFQNRGLPVDGVQHGGNYGLMLSGGLPIAFVEGSGNRFFHWGQGCVDELGFYGVSMPIRWVKTGSPRMHELQTRKSSKRLPRRPRRLLYAPTYLSVMTTMGSNIPWDAYLPLLRRVCGILNYSNLDVWVKVLNSAEMHFLPWKEFPRLTVLEKGSFADYMGPADVLLVDYLGGSPIYEALVTHRPILLYTGIENQRWDPNFLKILSERVHCFHSAPAYLSGLQSFVSDPEGFLKRDTKTDGADLLERYIPAVNQKTFWRTVESEVYGKVGQA